MSALLIALGAIVLFWLGYQFYSRAFERVWRLNPANQTPAQRHHDGIDYVPAKHWTILFGHHFSSIAGAAPVIGPIIALSIWGWMPALLWIVLGSVLLGGIHDFSALMVSLRSDGTSIANVAREVISQRAKIVFSIFIWLTLILVIAVFVHFCASTLVAESKIVIPTFGLIPIAMLIGFMLYDIKFNQISTTLLGLAMLGALIMFGNNFPIEAVKFAYKLKGYTFVLGPLQIWSILLLTYAFFASITPVQFLLQPRDYLCGFLLFGGIILGLTGLFVTRPAMQLPAFVGWNVKHNHLWPMLFVTVACGAISGFHSLIASGTTSKQLANERDARRIGYGAMIAEALVALLALLMVSAAVANMASLGEILKVGGGPIAAFSQGFAYVTKPFLGKYGGLIAIIILNAFILTTLDTATRIGRYLTQELLGLHNRYISTLLVIVASAALALGGGWNRIWPLFGAANQLVAALALIVVTAWLLSRQRSIKFTLLPSLIMLVTTIAALIYQIIDLAKRNFNVTAQASTKNWPLFFIALSLLGLAFYMLLEIDIILFRSIKERKERRSKQEHA